MNFISDEQKLILDEMVLYISNDGAVCLHSAINDGVNYESLAYAKFVYVIDNSDITDVFGTQELLKKWLKYNNQATDAGCKFTSSVLGSEQSRYYHYRMDFYLALSQRLRNHIAGLLVQS